MKKIYFSELLCIWKTQPCQAGDTLSGGERVADLRRKGLIEATEKGYIVTPAGQRVFDMIVGKIDTEGVFIDEKLRTVTDVEIVIGNPINQ